MAQKLGGLIIAMEIISGLTLSTDSLSAILV